MLVFVPKILPFGPVGYFCPKNDILRTLNPLKRFLKKFSVMKQANRYIKIILIVFLNKYFFG